MFIARVLGLYQYFVATLKQSSALFVKIQWSAQKNRNGAMCLSDQCPRLIESSHFATGTPGTSVGCVGDFENCFAGTFFRQIFGLFSICLRSLAFGLQSAQAESDIGEQALQLFHRLCMVFRDVEIAIMSRLKHGNQGMEGSPEHWCIRHVHPHTVHSQRIFWIHLKYSRLSNTAVHQMLRI